VIVVHVWLCDHCWRELGRPAFANRGAALCQGCGRSAGWVPVFWVPIELQGAPEPKATGGAQRLGKITSSVSVPSTGKDRTDE